MPVKLKYGNHTGIAARASGLLHNRLFRIALITFLGILVIGVSIFGYFYYHYQKVVDDRINSGPLFASVSQIYAAPREVRDGQKLPAAAIRARSSFASVSIPSQSQIKRRL